MNSYQYHRLEFNHACNIHTLAISSYTIHTGVVCCSRVLTIYKIFIILLVTRLAWSQRMHDWHRLSIRSHVNTCLQQKRQAEDVPAISLASHASSPNTCPGGGGRQDDGGGGASHVPSLPSLQYIRPTHYIYRALAQVTYRCGILP